MLVLSRKKNQSIQFPNLGISIEILRIDGNKVRVGVDAPAHIRVLRGELAGEALPAEESVEEALRSNGERHNLRNRLNTVGLALHLLQKQLDAGRFAAAEQTLTKALDSFTELDRLAAEPLPDPQRPKTEKPCRALIVEDDANERQLLAGFLELSGYQVDAVEDGVQAMTYLATHDRPDIVLLDMQMPRMDGSETVTAIRSNPAYQDIKLFVVSGSDQSTAQMPTDGQGIDHWFSKPLKPAEFALDLAHEVSR